MSLANGLTGPSQPKLLAEPSQLKLLTGLDQPNIKQATTQFKEKNVISITKPKKHKFFNRIKSNTIGHLSIFKMFIIPITPYVAYTGTQNSINNHFYFLVNMLKVINIFKKSTQRIKHNLYNVDPYKY